MTTVLIFWFLFSIAAAIFANNRGRSGFAWFFIALVLSPILALLFLAVSKDLNAKALAAVPTEFTHVRCPSCAEFVLPEAKVCKHCGGALPTEDNMQKKRIREQKETEANSNANLVFGVLFIIFLIAIASALSRCGN